MMDGSLSCSLFLLKGRREHVCDFVFENSNVEFTTQPKRIVMNHHHRKKNCHQHIRREKIFHRPTKCEVEPHLVFIIHILNSIYITLNHHEGICNSHHCSCSTYSCIFCKRFRGSTKQLLCSEKATRTILKCIPATNLFITSCKSNCNANVRL